MPPDKIDSTLGKDTEEDEARLERENFGFQEFEEVKVRRAGGNIEPGWRIISFEADEKTGKKRAVLMSPGGQHKKVSLRELYETQKEGD